MEKKLINLISNPENASLVRYRQSIAQSLPDVYLLILMASSNPDIFLAKTTSFFLENDWFPGTWKSIKKGNYNLVDHEIPK